MKAFLFAILAMVGLLGAAQAQAAELHCAVDPFQYTPGTVPDRDQGFVIDTFRSDCYETHSLVPYVVSFRGVGITLHQTVVAEYGIHCLGIFSLDGSYIGAKADVGIGFGGGGLGIFTNVGRTCGVDQIGIQSGFNAAGGVMTIERWNPAYHGPHRFVRAPVYPRY